MTTSTAAVGLPGKLRQSTQTISVAMDHRIGLQFDQNLGMEQSAPITHHPLVHPVDQDDS